MARLRYDVVVVGAGPAGSMAARTAAERGLAVLLLDRRAEVGCPVQCAEYVPRLIRQHVSLPAVCIAQATRTMRTHLPGGESHVLAAPGFILRRALFDRHLAIEAVRAGADLWLRSTAVGRSPHGLVVRGPQGEQEVAATVIVGADGARSTVGRWIGQERGELMAAAQVELVSEVPSSETEVYFAPEYRQGYAWFFPKGATANVGVGLAGGEATMADARAALELFLSRLLAVGKIKGIRAVAHTGGWVPAGGLLKGREGNVLLAGDAAGCVHPLTGAGILFAVISGRLAGVTAAEAVQAGNLTPLTAYERRCREILGPAIERGLAARRRLAEGWSDDAAALERLLRANWIGFEGYGRET